MRIDRYELFGPFASGGMASVHFGKLFASAGFQRVVAIKVPHAHVLGDPESRAMFVDEARIVARIRSPHVVATLDIVEKDETLYQVMEYASGPSLSVLLRTARARGEAVPIPVVLAILVDTLEGLHAAHETVDDRGLPLNVVHRDVSPQNILVVEDGLARIIDFGIASASGKLHLTQPGDVRGKVSYMSPEQVNGRPADRRSDVYAVGVVLYETLTGTRPFVGEDFTGTALLHALQAAPDPRALRADVSEELAAVVARALEKEPRERFPTARAMADALLALPTARASDREVATWLADIGGQLLVERRALIAALPSAEGEGRITIVPTDAASIDDAPTVTATSPSRRGRARAALLVVLAVTLLGAAASVAVLHGKRQGWVVQPAGLVADSSAAPSSPTLLGPLASAGSASSSSPELSVASAPVPVVRSRPVVRPEVAAKRPPRVEPSSATAATQPVQPPCCSGALRTRITGCVDNCPSGS